MTKEIVEWAPFKVKPGVDEPTVAKLSEAIQTGFMEKQKGYLRRELLRGGDGNYVDIIRWASMEDADAAMKLVADSPVCAAYFAAMDFDPDDPASHPQHFRVMRTY